MSDVIPVTHTAAIREVENEGSEEKELELGLPFSTISHGSWAKSVDLWRKHGVPLLEQQPVRPCPACGNAHHRPLFTSYDGYPVVECLECDCWYVPRWVDDRLFERFFQLCPEARAVAQQSLDKRASPENLALDLARIGAYLDLLVASMEQRKSPLRYLDIGAGMGSSLVAARDRGIVGLGIEVERKAIEVARARGADVRHPAEGIPLGPFDLISLWESLEHISDPLDVLTEARDLLAPDGLLALTIPNLDSVTARVMRADCEFLGAGYDSAGHINMFGVRQLERLLARAGFGLLAVDGQYSTNLPELLGYVMGRHRGATSMLAGTPVRYSLPVKVATFLQSIGPFAAFIERQASLAPILFAVAARREAVQRLSTVAARLADHRKTALALLVRQLPDLQGEINRRDELLQILQREVDRRDEIINNQNIEIGRRDGMVLSLQQRADELQARLEAQEKRSQGGWVAELRKEIGARDQIIQQVQAEVNRRDELLQGLQREIDRRDQIISSQNAEIGQRDELLLNLKQRIRELRAKLELQEKILQQREAESVDLQSTSDGMQKELNLREQTIDALHLQLDRIELWSRRSFLSRLVSKLRERLGKARR